MLNTEKTIILTLVAVLVSLIIGYLIGKHSLKPKGDIVFELYHDEKTESPAVRCTFKLDLDLDQIVKEDYILLGVKKTQGVTEYYRKMGL